MTRFSVSRVLCVFLLAIDRRVSASQRHTRCHGVKIRMSLVGRKEFIRVLAAGTAVSAPSVVSGAGEVDEWQTFGKTRCVKRGLLGRCDEYGDDVNEKELPIISEKQRELFDALKQEQDSNAYIAKLRQQTEKNRERNEREVAMKSFENSQAGEFGPFSR
jgi:hypothetical protein